MITDLYCARPEGLLKEAFGVRMYEKPKGYKVTYRNEDWHYVDSIDAERMFGGLIISAKAAAAETQEREDYAAFLKEGRGPCPGVCL